MPDNAPSGTAPGAITPDTPRCSRILGHIYVQVLIAIVAGVLLGIFFQSFGEATKPLGDGSLQLVKMIVAPIIFLTMVTGIVEVREIATIGRVAGRAFICFLFFSTLALILGVIAFTTGRYGAEALTNLGVLIATFYLISALFVAVVLGTVARRRGFSLYRLLRYLKEELLLVLSECRSLTNFIGNAVATVVVAKWNGTLDMERLRSTLAGEPIDYSAAPAR